MPYYPNFQPQYSSPEEQMLFAQFKMQMQMNQFSQQQQQSNQATGSQPQSDHQSFNLLDETEDENEEDPISTPMLKKTSRGPRLKAKTKKTKTPNHKPKSRNHKWTNPESTNARRYRFRVINEDPEHFGDDALPRPPELQRLAKSQHSGSNSTASSDSNPIAYQEFMAKQYKLDRKTKMQFIEQESEDQRRLIQSQRIAEDMNVVNNINKINEFYASPFTSKQKCTHRIQINWLVELRVCRRV
nr:hypothetical protein [Tanacetum cinerariifolium]